MSCYLPGREPRIVPAEYQEHLNQIGGMNRFDEPNFRIVWGETATDTVYGTDENGRRGAHVILRYGIAAWFIEVWKPPECFGTPETWYALTWDWDSDEPTIGEYPWRGMYFPAPFNLYVKHIENNVLTIDAMPLNHYILDLLVPNIIKAQEETYMARKRAILNQMAAERRQSEAQAMEAYLAAGPAFGGKAGTYESNREAWMKRIEEKQAEMKISRDEIVRKMGLGHVQRRRMIK